MKFKIGDKVKRVRGGSNESWYEHKTIHIGDIGTVSEIFDKDFMKLQEYPYFHKIINYELYDSNKKYIQPSVSTRNVSKFSRHIKIHKNIHTLMMQPKSSEECVKDVVKFIQNNYRRRVYAKTKRTWAERMIAPISRESIKVLTECFDIIDSQHNFNNKESCIKCGCSKIAINHFKWDCQSRG